MASCGARSTPALLFDIHAPFTDVLCRAMQDFCLHTPWVNCEIHPWDWVVSGSTEMQNRSRKHAWNCQHCPGTPRSVVPRHSQLSCIPITPLQPLSSSRGLLSSFLFQASLHCEEQKLGRIKRHLYQSY